MPKGMDLRRSYPPRSGPWGLLREGDDFEKRSLLATVDALRSELVARDVLVESLHQEIDLLHSIQRTSPVGVVPKQKRVKASRLHLDDLPDDLLVRVFAHLDNLFLASAVSDVCRRWRALAREPSLWIDVELHYGNLKNCVADARLFERALEAAPVVDSLECGLTETDPPALLRVVEACGVAAKHLCVNLDTAAPDAVLRLLWNSRQVLEVFCLREGPLSPSFFSPAQASRFWQMIEAAPRLRSLVLFLSQHSGLASCAHAFKALPAKRATLRTLFVDVGVLDVDKTHGELGVTLQLLIRAHQSSLVDVHLPMRVATPGALRATSRCAKLRRLSTQASADVHTLTHSSTLRELRLTVGKALLSHYLLLQQLGEMQQLTALRLVQLPPRAEDDVAVAASLLGKLSPQTALRQLGVTCLPPAAALDRLAMTPLPAPHLEVLSVDQSCGDVASGGCRLAAVRRLVHRRPGLHVRFKSLAVHGASPNRCHDDHCRLAGWAAQTPRQRLTFVGHPRDGCRVCGEHVSEGGTVVLLPPAADSSLPWCEVAEDDTVTPCKPVEVDTVTPCKPFEVVQDVPSSPPAVPHSPTSTSLFLKPAEPIKVSIQLSRVGLCGLLDSADAASTEDAVECAQHGDTTPVGNPLDAPTQALGEAPLATPVTAPSMTAAEAVNATALEALAEESAMMGISFDDPMVASCGNLMDTLPEASSGTPMDTLPEPSSGTPMDTLPEPSSGTPMDTLPVASRCSSMDTLPEAGSGSSMDTPTESSREPHMDTTREASRRCPLNTILEVPEDTPVKSSIDPQAEVSVEAPLDVPLHNLIKAMEDPSVAITASGVQASIVATDEASRETPTPEIGESQPGRRNLSRACRRAFFPNYYNYAYGFDFMTAGTSRKVSKGSGTSRKSKASKAKSQRASAAALPEPPGPAEPDTSTDLAALCAADAASVLQPMTPVLPTSPSPVPSASRLFLGFGPSSPQLPDGGCYDDMVPPEQFLSDACESAPLPSSAEEGLAAATAAEPLLSLALWGWGSDAAAAPKEPYAACERGAPCSAVSDEDADVDVVGEPVSPNVALGCLPAVRPASSPTWME